MGCKECIGLGVVISGIVFVWIQIIFDYFFTRDKDINKEEEKE